MYGTIPGRTYNIKVAGVSFNNEDGTSRQEILSRIFNNPGHCSIVTPVECLYEGERAVKLIDNATKLCIGWIPKTELASHQIFPLQMTVYVGNYKDVYHAVVSETIPPSKRQYWYGQKILKQNAQRPYVAYDVIAYRSILSDVVTE